MEKINTLEEAFESQGLSTTMPELTDIPEKYRDAVLAAYQLMVINDAVNENIDPNWQDSNEYKYEPYFWMKDGFSCSAYDYNDHGSFVGSRLCYRSNSKAIHASKTFTDVYKRFMVK